MGQGGAKCGKGYAQVLYLVKKIIKKTYLYLYYVPFTITSVLDSRYIDIYLGLCQEKNEQKLIKIIVKVYLILSQINIPQRLIEIKPNK